VHDWTVFVEQFTEALVVQFETSKAVMLKAPFLGLVLNAKAAATANTKTKIVVTILIFFITYLLFSKKNKNLFKNMPTLFYRFSACPVCLSRRTRIDKSITVFILISRSKL